jgi:hypothetical protein
VRSIQSVVLERCYSLEACSIELRSLADDCIDPLGVDARRPLGAYQSRAPQLNGEVAE